MGNADIMFYLIPFAIPVTLSGKGLVTMKGFKGSFAAEWA
jgi:hypothetical protein